MMKKSLKSNINVKQAVPFFMVVEMARSLDFYNKVLGFEIKIKWGPDSKIEWCWLQLGEASLMLQEYRSKPSAERLGLGVSIYFICEDALKIYDQINMKGLSPVEPFVGNNMWVVQLPDPDGYNIVFESPTDVAEETMYSDWLKTKKTN